MAVDSRAHLRSCAGLVIATRPRKMNVEYEKGVQYALRSYDTVDYGSYVHLNYRYVRLYSTRPLVQYQVAQLRHRTIHPRQVRNHEKAKSSREKELPEFPFKMCECEAMLAELNDEFDKNVEIVRGDPEMLNEWKNRNRSVRAYQRHKDDFEREVAAIIAERNRNG